MRFTVCIYQTVATEVTKTRNIFRSVVTSITPIPAAVVVNLTERLVYPIPYSSALRHRITLKNIPILLHTPTTITHSMQVFTQNKGTINTRCSQISFDFIHTAIHAAINIGIIVLFRPFILYGTIIFYRLQPIVCTLKVYTIARFISQRPDNDGRMVLGTFVHTLRTIHVCRQPSAILRQRCRAIAHTVRFDIRLIYHIQSVTVAKSVPIRVGRIMRIAHRIDIVLFHQADILLHQFLTDSTSQLGMFVPVNTFHQYRYPIDTETAVLYFRSAEPHPATGYFGHLARSILQLQKQCIKIRMFRTPCLHCRESLPRKRDEVA